MAKAYRAFTTISKLFTFAYFLYAVFVNAGKLYLNIIFGSIGLFFAIYDFFVLGKIDNLKYHIPMMEKKYKKQAMAAVQTAKTKQNSMKKIKQIIGLVDVTIDVVVVFFSIYTTTTYVTGVSVLMAVCIAVSWILRVMVAMITRYINNRKNMVLAAIELDVPIDIFNALLQSKLGELPDSEKEKAREKLAKETQKRKERKAWAKSHQPGLIAKIFKKK